MSPTSSAVALAAEDTLIVADSQVAGKALADAVSVTDARE
jgi:hypothetical protein